MNQCIAPIPGGADLLGYMASVLVLLAFSLRSLIALRSVAIVSNVTFIAYASAAHLQPVLVLHAALLPINLWRLWQSVRCDNAEHSPQCAPIRSD
jgi:CRP/FNR family transcriptional regulator, cyclic AMP receptor protein